MEPLQKVTELADTLNSLRPLDKEQEAVIMQKFRLDWNYNSNNLEGNSLTFGETKALILFGITAQGKPLKDHVEITGHDEAIKWVVDLVNGDYPLTENFIRELHTLLLKEPYEVKALTPDGKPTKRTISVGQYKTSPNHVLTKTGEIFRFATPEETPAKMHDLISWYRVRSEEPVVNAVILAAEFHYRFIRIHPFDDGNGRTARIIMNFILMKFGFPPVIIKTEDKTNYFSALQQADAGIIQPFIDYIATNLIRSLEIMIAGAKGESIEESDDVEKELRLLEEKVKGMGGEFEPKKTDDTMLSLYDHSITRLWNQFSDLGKKFERFYVKSGASIYSKNGTIIIPYSGDEAISKYRKFLTIATNTHLKYSFTTFNSNAIQPFNYQMTIIFRYMLIGGYTVSFLDKVIAKEYGEQLDEEEIEAIVKALSKAHTTFIEQKIQEVN